MHIVLRRRLWKRTEVIFQGESHIPLYGVGPVYVAVIITVTMAGILLSQFKIIAYLSFPIIKMVLLMIYGNLWLLILPVLYWLFLTVLMKCTEEKWLKNLYGMEYEEYCRRVNRCIPWFLGKHHWLWLIIHGIKLTVLKKGKTEDDKIDQEEWICGF